VDDRGVGMRVTWHPEGTVIVLSLWHGEDCAGTFRLPVAEASRLASLLLTSVTDWASMVEAQTARPNASNGD
jgi:hypothetical protein